MGFLKPDYKGLLDCSVCRKHKTEQNGRTTINEIIFHIFLKPSLEEELFVIVKEFQNVGPR